MATSAAGSARSTSSKNISPEKKEFVMQPHKIVSREQWIEVRKAHMAHEKEYTRARDRLSEERRALPWVKVDKNYVFDGPDGRKALADLFNGRSQLVVQHSCLRPTGTRAARAVRSGPMDSNAWCRIWPRATPRWSRYRA